MNTAVLRRVHRAGGSKASTTPRVCYICGRTFESTACPHTVRDQYDAVKAFRLNIVPAELPKDKPPTELLLADEDGHVWRIHVSVIGTLISEMVS